MTETSAWFDELVAMGAQATATTVIQSGEQHHVIVGFSSRKSSTSSKTDGLEGSLQMSTRLRKRYTAPRIATNHRGSAVSMGHAPPRQSSARSVSNKW